ncbi:MAG TPA: hypothetical protein GX497_07130 [Bacillus bacterium]|nr:hypothetical protein [Bacillus sp. (in: firmicutes)]
MIEKNIPPHLVTLYRLLWVIIIVSGLLGTFFAFENVEGHTRLRFVTRPFTILFIYGFLIRYFLIRKESIFLKAISIFLMIVIFLKLLLYGKSHFIEEYDNSACYLMFTIECFSVTLFGIFGNISRFIGEVFKKGIW